MGQTILITGANRGIGLALTTELLKGGHSVLATARDMSKAGELTKLHEKHPEGLHILDMDVTSPESKDRDGRRECAVDARAIGAGNRKNHYIPDHGKDVAFSRADRG